jgi:sortase A
VSRHREVTGRTRAPRSINQASKIMAMAKIESESKMAPWSDGQRLAKNTVGMLAVLLASFVIFMVAFTPVFYLVNQQQLRNSFGDELAQGTAPTGEVDFQNNVIALGSPLAIMKVEATHQSTIVVQGTDSGTLTLGAGHRRDTVMPGQAGTSVLMGRAWSYGGPFGSVQSIPTGSKIDFITGQGKSTYEVLGVRYQGDYELPTVSQGQGRLVLLTAKGAPFLPQGVVRLDAKLVSAPMPTGVVLSNIYTMPSQEREMGFDLRYGWALVLALEFLLISALAAVWLSKKVASSQLYLVFVPTILFALILVFDQVVKVLPNLL